jgi:hypothetical protein
MSTGCGNDNLIASGIKQGLNGIDNTDSQKIYYYVLLDELF